MTTMKPRLRERLTATDYCVTVGGIRAADPSHRRALQRELRAAYRKLINDVFIDLAASAGTDDPVANDPRRVFLGDRTAHAYRLAADLLTGTDAHSGEFLRAFAPASWA